MKLPKHTSRYISFLFSDLTLQVAKVNRSGGAFVSFFEIALPPQLVVNGDVVNREGLTQFLMSVKKQLRLGSEWVVIGLPETKATTRSLLLPPLEPDEVEQAIARKAGDFLPFPVKDEYLDWMLIDKLPDGQEKVLVSALPKTLIDGFTQCFESAALTPIAFETASLSLFRLLPPEARKISLAIDVGQLTTVLILGLEGNIEACSVIQDAEDILGKIEKLISYYIKKKTHGQIPTTIYLCGENATAQLAEQLKSAFKLQPVFLTAGIAKLPPAKQTAYALLASLARKEVEPPSDTATINILPMPLVVRYREEQRKRFQTTMNILLLIAFILFIGVSVIPYQTIVEARKNIARRALAEPDAISESVMVSPATITLLDKLMKKSDRATKLVDEVFTVAPSGILISGVQLDTTAGEILIIGQSNTRGTLLSYKEVLGNVEGVTKVIVPLSALENETNISFRVTLTVKN
ncbi:pilus assembly protein PilM [Candidatus Roizmanbacteria bacterium]|nr:pilus assembly protein PilM [Candidatus Roizmanbacteria bacterium]